LIGSDQLPSLHLWGQVEWLCDHLTFLLVERPGAENLPLPARLPRARFERIKAPLVPVSSSQVRAAVDQGQSIAKDVPEAVAAYIKTHRLYLDCY
jgi:nicotinic acid mononucleotide adenylyltransferase